MRWALSSLEGFSADSLHMLVWTGTGLRVSRKGVAVEGRETTWLEYCTREKRDRRPMDTRAYVDFRRDFMADDQ